MDNPLLSDIDAAEAHLRRAANRAGDGDLADVVKEIDDTIDKLQHDRELVERACRAYASAPAA